MKKICLISLGCVKNLVDSEAILSLFRNDNFVLTTNKEEADVIIVNTCGFIESAKEEGINTILSLIKYKAKLVVIGCLVERYYEELKKVIPEVDLWVKYSDEYNLLPSLIQNLFDEKLENSQIDFYSRVISTEKYTAYLKISEGCDNFCAFCAIPYIRGRFISYDPNKLIEYTKKIVKEGVKEIIVIGQDPTSYGKDLLSKVNLTYLLKELAKIDGLEFIRTLYLYPDGIDDELLELFKNNSKFPHYFDIPIQHASYKILKSMNRKHSKEDIINLYNKIKKMMPDAILRTTLIVGYPNETKEDFNELKEFIKTYKFNHLGVFTYSREEGTRAYSLKNQIRKDIKEKRKKEIMEIQAKISYELNKELINKVDKGIVIGKEGNDYLIRTSYNSSDDIDGKVILRSGKKYSNGDVVLVRYKAAFVYDLICVEE